MTTNIPTSTPINLRATRVASIDLLKGLVMVIMALDHVRDFFHVSAFYVDPADPLHSTLPTFFTRFITHLCAPAFCLLAGTSAYLSSRRMTSGELSSSLVKRGLWLILMELTVVNFGWFFDWKLRNTGLLVIWSLGVSMIGLAALIHLPRRALLAFCIVMIAGHNLLDGVRFDDNLLWSILHQSSFITTGGFSVFVLYPIIPWIAVMALGYHVGSYYDASYDGASRRRMLAIIGTVSLLLFLVLRATNVYGDADMFIVHDDVSRSLMSFLHLSKYPPSLQYLLVTLGSSFLFLASTEHSTGPLARVLSTFGRVPFFYYILHIYLIHLLAMAYAQLTGYGWQTLILDQWVSEVPALKGFGLELGFVYVVWLLVVVLLYPLCRWFDGYKQQHKQQRWLRYL